MWRTSSILLTALSSAPPCPDADPIHDTPPSKRDERSSDPSPGREPGRTRVWARTGVVHQASPRPSLQWALSQLIPSPELGLGEEGAVFGMRWQLTPVLYSFAADPRTNRWRWFVVEPLVRQSGSIELHVSPEYLGGGKTFGDRVGGRIGVRSYFGLIQRGDNLSVSIGSSYYRFGNVDGVSYEAGAYVLFGTLGLELGHAPGFERARFLTTLRLRYF